MRVPHNIAFFDLAILLEQSGDFFLGKAGVDTSHEQIGTRIARSIVFLRTAVCLLVAAVCQRRLQVAVGRTTKEHLPVIASVAAISTVPTHRRCTSSPGVAIVASVNTRRTAAIAVITATVI